MEAIILARVSTEEQIVEGQSIPAQLARARDYANKKGLIIKSEHQFDESSLKDKRTKFEVVIKELTNSNKKVALVVETIDRLQRSFKESVLLLTLIKQDKVEVHFIRENLIIHKNSNSSEFTRWDMGVMFARSYVLNIGDNVKRTFELKRKSGKWTFAAPLGYKNIPLDAEKRLRKDIIPDPQNSHIITRLFELFSTGNYSLKTLMIEAHKLGLKGRKGKNIVPSMLHHILRNPFYSGKMRSKYGLDVHEYETLTTPEIQQKCIEILRGRKTTQYKPASLPFTLRGMIRCSRCGCLVTPEKKKGKYVYYSCTNYKKVCKREWVREEKLLIPVYEVFNQLQLSDEKINTIVTGLRDLHEKRIKFIQKDIDSLANEHELIQKRISGLIDMATSKSITQTEYDNKMKEYRAQEKDISERMKAYSQTDTQSHIFAETVLRLAQNAKEIFEKSSNETKKRHLLNLILQNCRLNGKELEFSLQKPFDSIAYAKNHPIGLPG